MYETCFEKMLCRRRSRLDFTGFFFIGTRHIYDVFDAEDHKKLCLSQPTIVDSLPAVSLEGNTKPYQEETRLQPTLKFADQLLNGKPRRVCGFLARQHNFLVPLLRTFGNPHP